MSQRKVLVVDDDDNILYAFRQVLTKEGYTTIEARNGLEGLEKLGEEEPDIVFMDLSMPQMDGLEALRLIRELDQTIPVVIITGHGTEQNVRKALQLGAFDFLEKPLSVRQVRRIIQNALMTS